MSLPWKCRNRAAMWPEQRRIRFLARMGSSTPCPMFGVKSKRYQRSPLRLNGHGRRRVLTTQKTGCRRSFFISRGHPTCAYSPSTTRTRTGRNGRCWPSRPGHEELQERGSWALLLPKLERRPHADFAGGVIISPGRGKKKARPPCETGGQALSWWPQGDRAPTPWHRRQRWVAARYQHHHRL